MYEMIDETEKAPTLIAVVTENMDNTFHWKSVIIINTFVEILVTLLIYYIYFFHLILIYF